MRALGLDVGQKTIGLAITDEAGIAAHPHGVLDRAGNESDVSKIETVIVENGITDVVIGMPFDLDGRVGHRARRVLDFATVLRARIPATVEFHEQDERFTTAEAERVLIDADLSRAKRKDVIDQQAAALILSTWLGARDAKRI